ncbi:MAG: hypothetical protein PSX36_14000 [bacterium]|nr:hypothetical protein [bacterium]
MPNGYNNPENNDKTERSIKNGMAANFLTKKVKVVSLFSFDYLNIPKTFMIEALEATKK